MIKVKYPWLKDYDIEMENFNPICLYYSTKYS